MAYIEISPIIVSILSWVCWMVWGLFLFLLSVGGERVVHAVMGFAGLFCLLSGATVALFWINGRYNLVGLKA